LAKFKGIHAKKLAIQLLPAPEQIGPNDLLLFVQYRDLQTKTNAPNWPCPEILFKGGPSPKLGGLRNVLLSQKEPSVGMAAQRKITVENLIIAKFFNKQLNWKELHNRPITSRGRSKKKRGGTGNLKSRFHLGHGDLLAFADASLCGTTKREDIDFLRQEDHLGQQYKIAADIEKKNNKGKGGKGKTGGNSAKKYKRSAPVGDAKIHVYLGFSSDEDEEELPTG
jgi:hypothetical protein